MPYTLPPLPYGYSALEPHIDAKTMEIHHTKHHQAYIDKANKALEGTAFAASPVEEVLRNLEKIPEDKRKAVQNNAGGHANHSIFWQMLSPTSEGKPSGDLAAAIDKAFGGFDAFKEKFEAAALSQFGSGWAWLVKSGETLVVESTPNQDSPIAKGKTPLLGLDVWEHAYYLTYQNRRPEYVKAFWNIVNWKEVERRWKAI